MLNIISGIHEANNPKRQLPSDIPNEKSQAKVPEGIVPRKSPQRKIHTQRKIHIEVIKRQLLSNNSQWKDLKRKIPRTRCQAKAVKRKIPSVDYHAEVPKKDSTPKMPAHAVNKSCRGTQRFGLGVWEWLWGRKKPNNFW